MATAPTKTNASNSFEAGMITDIHPLRADNKSLTYAKNIEFVAAGSGSQLILQKRDGNEFITTLSAGFKPVAVAELDNVLYIVSFNFDSSTGEIGTFPSPKYNDPFIGFVGVVDMENVYKPLNNFHDGSNQYEGSHFFNSFTTTNLFFTEGDFVDINLSKSYDSSVNIILTDSVSPIRLINTRFSVLPGNKAEIIQHRTGNSTNSYSDFYFSQTELIPTSVSIPKLDFNGLVDGGTLPAGGYRYFFKYIKDDGAQTDIIEESRLVNVHQGVSEVTSYGMDGLQLTSKSVKFTLTNLDDSYYGIKVYFTVSSGDAAAVSTAFSLNNPYKIVNGKCVILHTGFESVSDYNKESIGVKYSSISRGKSLAVSNDRLVVANSEQSYSIDTILQTEASKLEITEGTFDIYHDNTGSSTGLPLEKSDKNYSNADFSYNSTGFWKGETYELGVVYITDNGLSPVYPMKGMDRLDSTFGGALQAYPALPINGDTFGDLGVNTKGVYRTASNGTFWTVNGADIIFKGTKLSVDIQTLLNEIPFLGGDTLPSVIPGYLNSAEASTDPWAVYYEQSTGKYYLRGTVVYKVTAPTITITLAGSGIQNPKTTLRFGSIEISIAGVVTDYGTKGGTNLTEMYGPPVDAKSASKGFFIVRKKRVKDKILEGIVVPTASFPTESRGAKENSYKSEFSFPANWTGCGVNSIKKDNVVLAPAPSLCMPFGTASLPTPTTGTIMSNLLDTNGVPSTVLSIVLLNSVPGATKVIVPLTYVSADITKVLFEGIAVQPAYATAGIPVLAADIDTTNKTIAVPISAFIGTDRIPKGTRVLSLQDIEDVAGKTVSADIVVRAPICDYNELKGWALYSPDTDCGEAFYSSTMHSDFKLAFTQAPIEGDIQSLVNPDAYNELLPYYTRLKNSLYVTNYQAKYYSGSVDFVGDGQLGTGSKSFTGILDRVMYAWYFRYNIGSTKLTKSLQNEAIKGDYNIENNKDNSFRYKIFNQGLGSGEDIDNAGQYWDGMDSNVGVAVKYGKYLGVKINSYTATDTPLKHLSPVTDISIPGDAYSSDLDYRNVNYFSSIKGFSTGFFDSSNFGAYCQVYSKGDEPGGPRSFESWKSIYDDDSDTEYIAISRRYNYNEFPDISSVIDLYGGDCYAGLMWKQVWYPRGIDEAPQATDLTAYAEGRRNIGMLNYGYVIPVPAQSNYNFNIRSKDRSVPGEFAALGRDRSFIPARALSSSRGNRLFDTGKINKGYMDQDSSSNKFFKLSDSAPYYKELFPNRVYASEPFKENTFINGFTIFKGLNYKDYNSELGPIYRLITLGDKLFVVFRDGVGIIGVNERTQVSTDTGGVFIDNADVLSQKATIISTGYGSDFPDSVETTNNYIYGVDMNRVKIWRTNGGPLDIISDTRVQNILNEILVAINSVSSDAIITVHTTYDPSKSDVSFTFYAQDPTDKNNYALRTLIYNELSTLNCWVCETDDHRKFFSMANNSRYSFTPIQELRSGTISKASCLYAYDNEVTYGDNNFLYDVRVDSVIRYSVVDDPGSYKVFENIWIAGDNPLPDTVTYQGDNNSDNGDVVVQNLSPYTNVAYYMKYFDGVSYVQCTGSMEGDSSELELSVLPSMVPPGRTEVLLPGDYISVENDGVVYRFTIISVNGTTITVDKASTVDFTGWNVVYGYKTPVWLTDSSIEDGYGKITCMSGLSFKNKPRSKWMRFEMTFKGTDQMYIGAIVTTYSKSYS